MQQQAIEVLIRARPSASSTIIDSTAFNGSSNGSFSLDNNNSNSSSRGIQLDEAQGKVLLNRLKNKGQADFTFTRVFGPESDQREIYAGCDFIQNVLQGINCCIMTYGQTNSGKTYTMYGKGWEDVITDRTKDGISSSRASINFPAGTQLPIKQELIQMITDNDSVASLNENDSGDENALGQEDIPDSSDSLGLVPRCIKDLFDCLNERRMHSEDFGFTISKYLLIHYLVHPVPISCFSHGVPL